MTRLCNEHKSNIQNRAHSGDRVAIVHAMAKGTCMYDGVITNGEGKGRRIWTESLVQARCKAPQLFKHDRYGRGEDCS